MENSSLDLLIQGIFDNKNPDQAWSTAESIIQRISPSYDFAHVRTVFDDAIRLFRGNYPGYCAIKTPYHDLSHTLDVFLCAIRLMHGVHISGEYIDDETISLLCIAALMHDIGYAQRQGEENGSGAQHTLHHIERGIQFMQHYLAECDFPSRWAESLACIIRCTSPERLFNKIEFPDPRVRLAGKILATADLVGQMADRTYLEKLLLLYQEFKEAQIGNYQSMYELLSRTGDFYKHAQCKLDEDYGSIYKKLPGHFRDYLGIEKNFYLKAIEKNLAYLSRVISHEEPDYLSMLKRNGIVEKVIQQPQTSMSETAAQELG